MSAAAPPKTQYRPQMLDMREAATLLGVPLPCVRTAIMRGQLRGYQVGHKFFVRKDDVDRLLQSVLGD